MGRLKDIYDILIKDGIYYDVIFNNDTIIIEEEWIDNGCKNDDDCIDYAYEVANGIIEKFPELELVEAYSHRHKYAVAVLKIKKNEIK